MEGATRRTLCRFEDDQAADAGGEWQRRHHGAHNQLVHAFAAHSECTIDCVSGLRSWGALPISRALRGAHEALPRSLKPWCEVPGLEGEADHRQKNAERPIARDAFRRQYGSDRANRRGDSRWPSNGRAITDYSDMM